MNKIIKKEIVNLSTTEISVGLMFLYNYLSILGFSTLKEIVDLNQVVKIVILLLLISFLPDLIRAKYHWNLFFMFLAFSGVLVGQFDGVTNYATIVAVIIGTTGKNVKPFIRALYYSLILGFFSVLFLRFFGFIPDRLVDSPRGITRHSFGFGSARGISEMYLTFCQLFVYLNIDKIKTLNFILLFIPIIPINILVDSRASTVLCILFLLIAYFIYRENQSKIVNKVLYFITVMAYFISFFMIYLSSFLYSKSSFLLMKIDNILSSRLMLGQWYLEHFPVKFFGQWIPIDLPRDVLLSEYNTDYLMLDSGYMTMLVEGGLIITAVMTIIIMVGLKKMQQKNDNIGLLIWLIASLNLIQTRLLNINSIEILLLSRVFELSDNNKGKYLRDIIKR